MWFRVSRVRAPYPTPLIGGSGITPGPPRLFHFGMSPSGKAQDFDSCIRAFEPRHPSQCGLALPARRSDSVAQQAEQLPFKQWVRGSNPRWVTKKRKPVIHWDCGFSLFSAARACCLYIAGSKPLRFFPFAILLYCSMFRRRRYIGSRSVPNRFPAGNRIALRRRRGKENIQIPLNMPAHIDAGKLTLVFLNG